MPTCKVADTVEAKPLNNPLAGWVVDGVAEGLAFDPEPAGFQSGAQSSLEGVHISGAQRGRRTFRHNHLGYPRSTIFLPQLNA